MLDKPLYECYGDFRGEDIMKKCIFYRITPPPPPLGVDLLIVNYPLGKSIRSFASVDDLYKQRISE